MHLFSTNNDDSHYNTMVIYSAITYIKIQYNGILKTQYITKLY